MTVESNLSLSNEVFRTYVLCVAALSLKMSFVTWHIAYRGYTSGGFGVQNPEDAKEGILNKNPKDEDQLKPFEPVERLRRILMHDVENNISFFIVGFLYVLLGVGCDNAIKSYTYLKFAHYFAYLTHQKMEVRAFLWILMSLSFVTICVQMICFVLSYDMDSEVKATSHSTL